MDRRRHRSYFGQEIEYPNDEVDLGAEYAVIEKRFDPALGFVPRAGVKRYRLRLNWRPRLYSVVRRLRFGFRPRLITDTGNDLQTRVLAVEPLSVDFETGDSIDTRILVTREALTEDFEIIDDVTIPEDSYDYTRYRVGFETHDGRPVNVAAEYEFGRFFGGQRTDVSFGLGLRPSRFVTLSAEYERNDVRLPDGDFVVRIVRGRVNLQFSPDVSWSNYVQFDNASDEIGLNSRVRWILRPGRDLFLVLNQGWNYDSGETAPTVTRLIGKVGITLRF